MGLLYYSHVVRVLLPVDLLELYSIYGTNRAIIRMRLFDCYAHNLIIRVTLKIRRNSRTTSQSGKTCHKDLSCFQVNFPVYFLLCSVLPRLVSACLRSLLTFLCPLRISLYDAPIGLGLRRRPIGTKPSDAASGPHSHWSNGAQCVHLHRLIQ